MNKEHWKQIITKLNVSPDTSLINLSEKSSHIYGSAGKNPVININSLDWEISRVDHSCQVCIVQQVNFYVQ